MQLEGQLLHLNMNRRRLAVYYLHVTKVKIIIRVLLRITGMHSIVGPVIAVM